MKLAIPVLVLALGSACAPPELSIRILGASALDPQCKAQDDNVTLMAGSINLALTQSYYGQFAMQSDLQQIVAKVDEDVVAGPDRNDFIGVRIRFKYSSSTGATFADQAPRYVYVVIPAGSQDSSVRFNLLTPEVAEQLVTLLPAGAPSMDLFVTFWIEGHLFSQVAPGPTQPAPMRTNEVTFPIRVVNVPPVCVVGTPVPDLEAPCGNLGQDSVGFSCT